MTGGKSPIGYLKAYHTNLYLSADSTKVREALEEGTLLLMNCVGCVPTWTVIDNSSNCRCNYLNCNA